MIKVVNESFDYSDLFNGKKYQVSAGDYSEFSKNTDDPSQAIELWFKLQKKYPSNVNITTFGKQNAQDLIDFCTDEFIEELDAKYNCPYRLDWILDIIHRKQQDGVSDFSDKYPDSISPFTFG